MSEKVSLMNQLFLIYYEASEKMSLSWVKLFFSCVKPSENYFFTGETLYFMRQAEWKKEFFHVSSWVKKFFFFFFSYVE